MSSSSSATTRSRVLRGSAASTVRRAAIDDVLVDGGTPFAGLDREWRQRAFHEGREAGYEAGYRAGMEAAAASVEAATAERTTALRHAMGALSEAVRALDARQVAALEHVEHEVVAAAFELATALLGRELELAGDPGADALARAMALVPDHGEVVARLHPTDAETFQRADRRAPGREPFTIVADPAVERGGCIVEVGSTQIDTQLGPAIERVREVLFG